jgi:uncharacterized membrane protein
MTNVGTGHFIFAGIFVIVFLGAMIYAYRKDLSKVKIHYKRVWMIILLALIIYFSIFFLNRVT